MQTAPRSAGGLRSHVPCAESLLQREKTCIPKAKNKAKNGFWREKTPRTAAALGIPLEVTPGFEMPEQAFDLFFVTLFRVSCVCFRIEHRKNKTAKAYLRLSSIDLLRENERENF